jgi:phosphomannomutase
VDLGVAMTPTVGVQVDAHHAAGGMIVTASHNPQEWNGLKCLIGDAGGFGACAPDARAAAEIVERFRSGTLRVAGLGTLEHEDEPEGWHLRQVLEFEELVRGGPGSPGEGKAVVVDSVNSSGAGPAAQLLRALGFDRVIHLGDSDSGVFPHPPEPTRENLSGVCEAIRRSGASLGFAQDPDADRLAIVDETGEYIGEEYTLVLAAEALLRFGPEGRRTVVTNLSTSRMIDDVAARHGARVVRTAVGEANVVQAMKRENAAGREVALGGEGNGGVIWPDITYVRDSLSAMALVVALMARTGKTVRGLVAAMPRYAIEKRKVDLAKKEDAVPAVEKVAAHWKGHRVDRQDGVRVDFSHGPLAGKAWIHVRASNTEPIMRLIAEAPEAAQARAILDEAAKAIGR